MSIFSSYAFCNCEEPEYDIALDVLNKNGLRLVCLNCDKTVLLKISPLEYRKISKDENLH